MSLYPGRFAGGWASRATGLIYREVPKAACSTLGQLMHHADHGRFFAGDVHDATEDVVKWPSAAFADAIARPDRFVFSAIRNPYARLVACYHDKVCTTQRDGSYYRGNLRAILMQHYGADLSEGADPRPGFRRFVLFLRDTLRNRDRFWFDRHWTPQAQHLRSFTVNGLPFDHLFHVEHFADGVAPVLAKLPPDRRPMALPQFNVSARPDLPLDSYFDDLTLHLVHEIYRWDFDLFGYRAFDPATVLPDRALDLAALNQRLADPHPPHWAGLGG
ncbi:sulfotransferase family 2 domain-containing protein [Roseibaca sp. Y0-43]|nr:sulfotransferase family 2 domain-containing protein [Roseibaca sp. Y0-43]